MSDAYILVIPRRATPESPLDEDKAAALAREFNAELRNHPMQPDRARACARQFNLLYERIGARAMVIGGDPICELRQPAA